MAATYQLKRATAATFMWNLAANNYQVILTSETYNSKNAAQTGIASCRVNSPIDERYERKRAVDGQYYFVLKAANGEPLGRSEMYTAAGGMETGIASCKANGPNAGLDDRT